MEVQLPNTPSVQTDQMCRMEPDRHCEPSLDTFGDPRDDLVCQLLNVLLAETIEEKECDFALRCLANSAFCAGRVDRRGERD